MKNPKIVGIKFADNDFSHCIKTFLEIIKQEGISSYRNLDKELLVSLFNKTIDSIYYLAQNKGSYPLSLPLDYLRIEVKDVFFDEEVARYLLENRDNLNCEFHVLDAQCFEPYIYSA